MENAVLPSLTIRGRCRVWLSPRTIASFCLLVSVWSFVYSQTGKWVVNSCVWLTVSKATFILFASTFFPFRRLYWSTSGSVELRDLSAAVQRRHVRLDKWCCLQPFNIRPAVRSWKRWSALLCYPITRLECLPKGTEHNSDISTVFIEHFEHLHRWPVLGITAVPTSTWFPVTE